MDKVLRKSYFHILQLFSANIIKAGFGFLGSIFVLRGWSTSDIGDIYTLVGVLLLCFQLGDLGSGGGFIKMMTQPGAKEKQIMSSYLAFKVLIAGLLLCAFFCFLAFYFFVSPTREVLGLAIVFAVAISGVIGGYFVSLLNAKREYKKLSIAKTLPPLVKTGIIIILFITGNRSFYWLLFAFMLPPIVTCAIAFKLNTIPLPKVHFRAFRSKYGKRLYYVSKWVCIITLCQTGFSQIDIFMLKTMSSDYQLSQFVSAQKLSTVVLMLSQALFTVMLPKMHDYQRNSELWTMTKRMFLAYLCLGLTMIPGTWLTPYVVPLVMGPRYIEAIPILNVFLFQTLGAMFVTAQTLVFFRKNALRWLALISMIQLGLNYIGNSLLIPQYKALGAIWASAILNNVFYWVAIIFCLFLFKRDKGLLED